MSSSFDKKNYASDLPDFPKRWTVSFGINICCFILVQILLYIRFMSLTVHNVWVCRLWITTYFALLSPNYPQCRTNVTHEVIVLL